MANKTITESGPNLWQSILNLLQGKGTGTTTFDIRPQTPQPQQTISNAVQNLATPQPTMNPDMIQKAIQLSGGQNAPMGEYAPQIADAQKYPFFKDNPLIPVIQGQLETNSGAKVTMPNNLENWGINYPGNNETFSNMTKQQVLDRYISGVGQRDPNYSQFRTGKPLTDQQLLDYAKTYDKSNPNYGANMIAARKYIMSQLSQPQ